MQKRGYIPSFVLDIGASDGNWTVAALQIWPNSQYLLLEALEERRPDLERLREACPDNVQYEIAAMAAEQTLSSFGATPDGVSSSFTWHGSRDYLLETYKDAEHVRAKLDTMWSERQVQTQTVDSILRKRHAPHPDLMKLDVQGYELEILKGAAETIHHADLVLLECQFFRYAPKMPLVHEMIAWMAERRFYPYEIVDILRRPFDNAMGQCDVLFCKGDHWLRASPRWE